MLPGGRDGSFDCTSRCAGDLTTNNVLLVEHEEDLARPFSVKVSDFGLSRVHASESAISTNTFGTVRCRACPLVYPSASD